MYIKKEFSEQNLEILHQFIKDYPLATIITYGDNGLMANLIPVSFHENGGKGIIRLHLARMNPQLKHFQLGGEVLFVFNGPQAYVTPTWYPTKKENGKVVPTWNYSTVQVRGLPTVVDDPQWILQQIKDLTSHMESGRENPWQVSDAPEDFILGQLKVLAGVEIPITSIIGKFKMSQNQSEENRAGVVSGFSEDGKNDLANFVSNRGYLKK